MSHTPKHLVRCFRIVQQVANCPLCQSETCVMLLLHLLCNYGPSLPRDACFCHPWGFERASPGFDPVSDFTPFFSSVLNCVQGIKRSGDTFTDGLWWGSWWEHSPGLGTPWSSCFIAVSNFYCLCPIEPVTDLLCVVSQTER